jgi:hypothetical protein
LIYHKDALKFYVLLEHNDSLNHYRTGGVYLRLRIELKLGCYGIIKVHRESVPCLVHYHHVAELVVVDEAIGHNVSTVHGCMRLVLQANVNFTERLLRPEPRELGFKLLNQWISYPFCNLIFINFSSIWSPC